MKRKHYSTLVNAPREKVWKTLWGEETYPKWTAAFAEGSKVKTDWQEGGKVLFLNGNDEGMVSRIEEIKEPEKMIFKHLGMVYSDGREDYTEAKTKGYAGAEEIYYLKDHDGQTEVKVEMDLNEEQEEYFDKAWSRVFEDLKQLVEDQ